MLDSLWIVSIIALSVWVCILLLPWQPWRTREVLQPGPVDAAYDLSDITVLIPARNEAKLIAQTLNALQHQGRDLQVIVVDDDSDDGTAEIARNAGLPGLRVVESHALPEGWTGKLWAQEQGLQQIKTRLTLLLDADITLQPGMLPALKQKLITDDLHFVSLMAKLRFDTGWEKMLMPAFTFFFKLLYPFALANKNNSSVAAAAGGCILVETSALLKIGGMASIKEAIIDDCSLAKKIKQSGYSIWIGLTRDVISQRPYSTLDEIWQMVARTAFTQLKYSISLLFLCSLVMSIMYWWPMFGVLFTSGSVLYLNLLAYIIMCVIFLPTLLFYRFNPVWAVSLPFVATLYLMMTWHSAIRYWRGEKSRWKGRSYRKHSS